MAADEGLFSDADANGDDAADSFFVDRVWRRNNDVRTFFDAAADVDDGDVANADVVDEIRFRRLPRLRTMSG